MNINKSVMIELYALGMPVADIATKAQCTFSCARFICSGTKREHGWPGKPDRSVSDIMAMGYSEDAAEAYLGHSPRKGGVNRALIRDLLKDGYGTGEIQRFLGCSDKPIQEEKRNGGTL